MSSKHILTDDGCRIAYRLEGPQDAPVLMLSNSLGTNMGMWAPQVDAFVQNFRLLRYDSRGHGGSDSPAGGYSLDRLGRDALAILDALELQRVHFCGLSLGGMIGQWLAVRAPERLERLVLANTSAYMGPPDGWQARIEGVLAEGMTPLAEASIARWFTPAFAAAQPLAVEPVRAMLLATDRQGYAGCCAAIRDMDQRPTAALNRTPTLVIAGSEDPSTSVADAKFLVDTAGDARLQVLSAAHLSNVEAAEDFNAAVSAFLSTGR